VGRCRVSCVIPVHDGERHPAAAIESVVTQDHPPLEVIVVDDGSADGSAAVAEAFGPPVRVIRRSRQGPGGARNAGIHAAKGDLVAFLDADDLYVPGKLRRQVARFVARPELDVSLGLAENFWEPGLEDEEARYRAHGKVYAAHVFGTALVRREVFERVGFIDARRVHGDQVEWFARLTDAGATVEVLDEVLVLRRMHRASLSHTSSRIDAYVDLVKERLDRRRGRAAESDGTAR